MPAQVGAAERWPALPRGSPRARRGVLRQRRKPRASALRTRTSGRRARVPETARRASVSRGRCPAGVRIREIRGSSARRSRECLRRPRRCCNSRHERTRCGAPTSRPQAALLARSCRASSFVSFVVRRNSSAAPWRGGERSSRHAPDRANWHRQTARSATWPSRHCCSMSSAHSSTGVARSRAKRKPRLHPSASKRTGWRLPMRGAANISRRWTTFVPAGCRSANSTRCTGAIST